MTILNHGTDRVKPSPCPCEACESDREAATLAIRLGMDTDRESIRRELAEWYAAMEAEINALPPEPPNPCPADRAWFARVVASGESQADEPTPIEVLSEPAPPAEWPAWVDEDRWELGPDEEPDYAVLMAEAWTLAPNGWPDSFDMSPGGVD